MRITSRGQITIPKRLRERFGITTATELEFVERDNALLVVKKRQAGALERFRGMANAEGLPGSTDELLALLRDDGHDETA